MTGSPNVMVLMLDVQRGGAARLELWLADGLRHQGFSVEVVCTRHTPRDDRADGADDVLELGHARAVPAVRSPLRTAVDHAQHALARRRLAHRLRLSAHRTPDVVICCGPAVFPLARNAFPAARTVVHLHSSPGFYLGTQTGHLTAAAGPARLAFQSVYAQAKRRQFAGLTGADAVVVHCAADAATARTHGIVRAVPISNPALTRPAEYDSVAPRPLRFVAVGRVSAEKAPALLVRAFAQSGLAERARLVFVGDGPEVQQVRALSDHLGVAASVEITGWVDEPMRLLRPGDVVTLASPSEGLSLSLLDAFTARYPCIATRCAPSIEELLAGDAGSLLVPVDDVSAFADAMRLADARANELCEAARTQRAVDHVSPEAVLFRWRSLLDTLSPTGSDGSVDTIDLRQPTELPPQQT